jgi:hypothetical protein
MKREFSDIIRQDRGGLDLQNMIFSLPKFNISYIIYLSGCSSQNCYNSLRSPEFKCLINKETR